MALLKSLSHRPFALLWTGQTLSRLGDSLYQVALAWWVVQTTNSAVAMSGVFISAFIPSILFTLVGGVTVDRFSRVRIMVMSDLLRGLLMTILATLAWTEHLEVWHVYGISALFGAVNAFFGPAYGALIPDVTPAELLPSANALTSLSIDVSGIAGPTLAAFVAGFGDIPAAFGLNAASFFISGICLLPLDKTASAQAQRAQTSTLRQSLREGITVVTRSSWLWFTVISLALLNLTGRSPMNVSLPFLVKDDLHSGVISLGVLYSTFSAGSIVGALVIGRLPPLRRRGRVVYSGLLIVGLMTAALGLPFSICGIASAIFVLGVSLSVSNLTWANVLQSKVERSVLGRVASINTLGSTSLLPFGFALVGRATDQLGAPAVFIIGGLSTAFIAGIGLTIPSIRKLD